MYHLRRIKVLLATCMLACASLWAQDVKVAISSATTDSYHNGEGADKAIDGKYSTMWHSGNNGGGYNTTFPVTFTITLKQATHVDYVRYVPRTSGDNGNWDEVKVEYCSSTDGSSFVYVGTFNLNGASSTYDFYLNGDKGVTCGQVRFTINSGKGGWASAAEIEAHNLKDKFEAFSNYFSDDLCTTLRSGVTSSNGIADADVKALVEAMLADPAGYKKFRVGEYKAYMTLETLRQKLGVNSYYSSFENPTGIYLKKGESCIVAVSDIGDEPVRLKMRNWLLNNESSSYPLRNGLNFITATTEGNVFVDYYTDDYKSAPEVKMHFINAPVRGYWDQETMDDDDWTKILNNLTEENDSSILVVQAKHVQVAYPVFCWKKYCPQPVQVDSLMTMYQQILWAERDMLGVEKYNIEYPNRQFAYVVKEFSGGAMAAGGEGTLTPVYSMDGVMTPDGADLWVWGIAHEFGHTNQVNPGLRWSGCIEVTNNIYSSWAELHVNNVTGYLRLEDEVMTGGEFRMRGGRMQAYFEEALRKEKPWMLHEGQDFYNETPRTEEVDEIDENGNSTGKKVTVTKRNYDHFVKLTPFWQLNLWGTKAEKCKDIIPMTVQGIRTQRSTSNFSAIYNTAGKEQMNWMKLACDSAKINLLPFFEKAGMLRPINAHIDSWNIITEEMINELKNHVARQGYPTPTEEINYINGHNYHIYRDGLKLNVAEVHGELNGEMVTIQHSMAQNAVAFETYNINDELIRITMYGLGSDDAHSYTQVLYPSSLDPSENAAYIMAVGYDGERQRVYQTYASEDEAKYAELGRLLAGVEEALTLPGDETNTKVGYYKLSTLADLNAAYETAKAVYDNKKTSSYVAAYDKLYAEYEKVQNARIGIVEGNAYRLTSKAYPTLSMSAGASDVMIGEQTNDYDTQKWYFEGSGTEGYYYLKNKATSTYPGNVQTGQPLSLDKTTRAEAHAYKLQDMGNGIWALVGATGLHCSASQSYNIVGWKADADASQWYITAVEVDYNAEALHDLKSLIEKTEALIAEVESNDACNSISTVLSQAKTQVAAAKAALEAGNSSAYEALNEKYTALHDAALDVLKRKLSTLIYNTNSLISQCGEVIYTPATLDGALSLQTTDPNGDFYLSTNAEEPKEGNIAYLVDKDDNSYFHSAWSVDVNATHYLQVDLGDGKSLKEFTFTYRTKKGPFPYEIKVYGSNEKDGSYTYLKTFSKDDSENALPTVADQLWTSSVISSEMAYRYLRFEVTNSGASGINANPKGEYCFVMSYFGVAAIGQPESYVVTNYNVGEVTDALLLATYKQNQEAQASYDIATTEAQLQKAIAKLQAQYNALSDAYLKNYIVQVNDGGPAEGGVRYIVDGKDYVNGAILKAPSTLSASELNAITVKGYDINISVEIVDNVILVTYEKLYTVCIQGGEGKGGLCYYDMAYKDGDQFMPDFADEEMTLYAIPVTGYTSDVDVDHEEYTITVTYSLDRTGWGELVYAAEELIASCYVDGELKYINSAYADDIVDAKNAIATAKEQGDNATTLSEYAAAKEALNAAMSSLTTAIQNAEAEAEQREEARETLRDLIDDAEALIAECGTYGYGNHMVETPVGLQVNDANAAYYLSTNAQESREGDISNLLTSEGFFHSSWSGSVGEAHYLQVDMGVGQSLQEFVFGYTTRDNGDGGPHPSIIVVSGSNSLEESFVELGTFDSGLPTTGNTSWNNGNINASQAYRYLRFTVTESKGTNGCKHDNDEYYFAMSEFALKSVSYETSYYVELPSYSNVTEEQLLAVVIAMKEAEALANESYDKAALEDAATSLQALCEELERVHNDYSYLPITLTDDTKSPVLYIMNSARGNNKVLQYNADDNNFSIVTATEADASQLFYFTKGTKKGQVYVHPFTAEGQVLAASDKTNGDNKVFVAEKEDATAMQWTFEQENIDDVVWYSLKGVDAPYFSNIYGGAAKMGFYGLKDEGSRFTFTEKKYHKVTIGQYLHTSLYLDYATTIPEGVKAYIATNPSAEGTIDLVKLQGGVLPANTGVILYSETPDTCYFLATNASATDNVDGNLLKGCASEQYVGGDDTKKYYIFGRKDDNVGLYWARMDYTADGTYVGNDEGTHFKASANKVYLELDATSGVALSGFRFRVGDDETGIKSVTIGAEGVIYDLYGRRIMEVVTPGLYIINGEKRYINLK